MKTWDIFCRVIDNYGDIGICWRLARQLVGEHNYTIRLWVDELAALKQIWPEATLNEHQVLSGVTVCLWKDDCVFDDVADVADVVIEAFACNLPESYIASMKKMDAAPIWINLEYLSAESWVEGCHQLASMHPKNGLKKTFYFPGFTDKTGGLLRERNLLVRCDEFNESDEKFKFLKSLGVSAPKNNALIISLFSYENNKAIQSLLGCWSQSTIPVLCLVPAGKSLTSINQVLDLNLIEGECFETGSLTLHVIPFLTQVEYDYLLWSCDINFVRGEDSFVRAQWAGKPFVWHIYPQEEDVHLIKMDAYLEKYLDAAEPSLSRSVSAIWHSWNKEEDCANAWSILLNQYENWQLHSKYWRQQLSEMPDLATNLVFFCQKEL